MRNGDIVENLDLDNGETLEIIDQSRMIGKDTWLITLVFRINIDIEKKITKKIMTLSDEDIRERLGKNVVYEARHERHFINEKDRNRVLSELKDSFLKTNLKYLSHPDFSHKYVNKKYNDTQKNR